MHRWLRDFVGFGALFIVALVAATPSGALTLGFDCITNNIAGDCNIGEAQLEVEVTAGPAANQVSFEFTNSGPAASSITDIYFDDVAPGPLLGIVSVVDGSGVNFERGAAPMNLPGGNNADPDFVANREFNSDSEPPTQPNGVNPGETLTLIFNIRMGHTFAGVLAALGNGDLRIGIHTQGFATGGSESLVSVPEPGTALLLAGPLLLLGSRRRIRQR